MNLNTDLIKKTLGEVEGSIRDICMKEDLTIEYLNPKINEIESNMNKLDTLNLFINDEKFTKEVCALEIVAKRILDNQFDLLKDENFRSSQIDFLNSISLDNNKDTNLEKDLSPKEKSTKETKEAKEVLKNKIKNKYTKDVKSETDKIIDKINENLETYFANPQEMKKYLQYMSKFYQYSENNSMLIQEQFEGARAIGSFKFWNNQGYKINKGEKGIKILTPASVTYFKDKNGEEKQLKLANKEEKLKIKNKEIDTYQRIFFKVGHVFDISQTNAPVSDLPKIFPNKWLEGEVKNYDIFYKALEKVADKINFKIIEPTEELGVVKGVCYPTEKKIALNPRNSQLQNVKTLLHELGHGKLHTMETRNNYSKQEKEYQAEMVAYATCSYFGLDTSEYSLAYLDSWTKDMDISERKEIIKEVKNTVSEFIETIEEELSKNLEATIEIEDIEIEDIEIEDIEIEDDMKYEASIAEALTSVIDGDEIEDDGMYVKFNWSEHERIKENSIYKYEDANKLLGILTEICKLDKNHMGYYKTSFAIYDNKYCNENPFYRGRFDIGDGYAVDLSNHIDRYVNEEAENVSQKAKDSLFKMLGINTAYKNNQLDNAVSL